MTLRAACDHHGEQHLGVIAVLLACSSACGGGKGGVTDDPPVDVSQAALSISLGNVANLRRPLQLGQNFNYFDAASSAFDIDAHAFYPGVVEALERENPAFLRYPGGLHGNTHRFDQTIGPLGSRLEQPSLARNRSPIMAPATIYSAAYYSPTYGSPLYRRQR